LDGEGGHLDGGVVQIGGELGQSCLHFAGVLLGAADNTLHSRNAARGEVSAERLTDVPEIINEGRQGGLGIMVATVSVIEIFDDFGFARFAAPADNLEVHGGEFLVPGVKVGFVPSLEAGRGGFVAAGQSGQPIEGAAETVKLLP